MSALLLNTLVPAVDADLGQHPDKNGILFNIWLSVHRLSVCLLLAQTLVYYLCQFTRFGNIDDVTGFSGFSGFSTVIEFFFLPDLSHEMQLSCFF